MISTKYTPSLLVMAGGTGGHIFPGLAVADKLKEQGWAIHWLGTPDRMEAKIVPEHGYDISFINITGLRNKGMMSWVMLPFRLMSALSQAIKVIKTVKPDVVLGMGGYASAPGGLAAWLMKKPLVIHEQNAAAGLTNKLLSRLAKKVCCAFPNAFDEKTQAEVVGNPLRENIGRTIAQQDVLEKQSHNILVVGGSLGAQVLNQIIPNAFITLNEQTTNKLPIHIWHQTGKGKQAQVLKDYSQHDFSKEQVRVAEFINDIAQAYRWADVVICRAGALTVSELARAATPAIFVPLPHAVDDHQTKNAQYLVARGAAIIVKQSELTCDRLVQQLHDLFKERATLNQMSKAAYAAADLDATDKVATICQQLLVNNETNTIES